MSRQLFTTDLIGHIFQLDSTSFRNELDDQPDQDRSHNRVGEVSSRQTKCSLENGEEEGHQHAANPVRGGCQTQTSSTDLVRENFTEEHPENNSQVPQKTM